MTSAANEQADRLSLMGLLQRLNWLGLALILTFCAPLLGLFALLQGMEVEYLPRLWSRLLSKYTWDTFALLIGTGLGAGILGGIVAIGTSVFQFPGRRVVILLSFLPIAIPAYLVAYVYGELLEYAGPLQSSLREVMGWKQKSDYWFPEIKSLGGGITVSSLVLFPYVFVSLSAALRNQLALAVEVGRTSGRGLLYSLGRIAVPLLWPAAVAGMLLASLEAIGDFGMVEYWNRHLYFCPVRYVAKQRAQVGGISH